MGRILFAPETFNLGETTRCIEIAKAIQRRHTCLFAGYSARYASQITSAGFEYRALQPQLSERQANQLIRIDQGRGVRHSFTVTTIRARVKNELNLLREFPANVVVIGSTLSQFLSARIAGVTLVYAKPFAYTRPYIEQADSILLFSGSGAVARNGNVLAARLMKTVAARLSYIPKAFRVVAAEYKLSLPHLTLDNMDADHNLITSISGYIQDFELPDNYHFVGPIYAKLPIPCPNKIYEMAKARRPLIYCSVGSSGNRNLVLAILRAISCLDVNVVAPVARYLSPADTATLPAGVHIYDMLPAHTLGDAITMSVIHGGEGTVQTACYSGKPFIGVGLQPEQRNNIEECVRFGNAIRVTQGNIKSGELKRTIASVLSDETMREKARQLKIRIADIDGAHNAAEYINNLICA